MRIVRIIGVFLSILVAISVVLWVKSINDRAANEAKVEAPKPLTIVVAAEPFRYGERLDIARLKIIDWNAKSLPADAFAKFEDIGIGPDGPYMLAGISEGSPILKTQITGPGQKPNLSSRLSGGQVAVTIPVNVITGVAGFVLPDEKVDVLLTRNGPQGRFVDVILENVKVLAVDSLPETEPGKPMPAKSVTFAVAREQAQKLVVAAGLGEIALVLKATSASGYEPARRISDAEVTTATGDSIGGADAAGTAQPAPGSAAGNSEIQQLKSQVDQLQSEISTLKGAAQSGTADGAPETATEELPLEVTIFRGLAGQRLTVSR